LPRPPRPQVVQPRTPRAPESSPSGHLCPSCSLPRLDAAGSSHRQSQWSCLGQPLTNSRLHGFERSCCLAKRKNCLSGNEKQALPATRPGQGRTHRARPGTNTTRYQAFPSPRLRGEG
jgi:hypothetical protein